MTDSATTASEYGSKKQSITDAPAEILARLEEHKERYPTCEEYWILDELEASYLLLAMAATLKVLVKDVKYDKIGSETLRQYARDYRKTVKQGKALYYLANLSAENQLSVYGMRIRAKVTKH